MAHVKRWLASRGLGAGDLTPAGVEEFLVDRRTEGYTLWLSPKAMVALLARVGRGSEISACGARH